jgi:hypothetical protein
MGQQTGDVMEGKKESRSVRHANAGLKRRDLTKMGVSMGAGANGILSLPAPH